MESEPIWDTAHLAHVELLTPKPDDSLRFFTEIMGMSVTAKDGDSAYLRAYDDYEHHTLKLTAAKQPGMGHFAWRTRSPQALQRRVPAIEATGLGKGWTEGDLGHGPAYAFNTPDGHNVEIYYETEWYEAGEDKPALQHLLDMGERRHDWEQAVDYLERLTKVCEGDDKLAYAIRKAQSSVTPNVEPGITATP